MILSILQAHFNVKTILIPNGRGTPVDIIGAAADIDFAIYAFNYLRQTFFRCWNEFKRTHANPDKASYYRGLRDGLNAELKAAKQRAEQRQAYGLVVVDQEAAITRYVEEAYGNPPAIKQHFLHKRVFPRHGEHARYIAIESNPRSREMYARDEIQCLWVTAEGHSLTNGMRIAKRLLP